MTLRAATRERYLNRERYSFGSLEEKLKMPYLIGVQLDSFKNFLFEGLARTFADISPISDYSETLRLELEFNPYSEDMRPPPKFKVEEHEEFQEDLMTEGEFERLKGLKEELEKVEECRKKGMTYSWPIFVKARFINGNTGEIKEQTVFMGDFPMMTPQGTFIVNGTERVVVSQLVRSPGVIFQPGERYRLRNFAKHQLVTGTIHPYRGEWVEFDVEQKPRKEITAGVRVARKRRLPLFALLRALGYDEETHPDFLPSFVEHFDFLEEQWEKQGHIGSTREEALIEIFKRVRPGDPVTRDSARNYFETAFFNSRRYDLSRVGRHKLNRKLREELDFLQKTFNLDFQEVDEDNDDQVPPELRLPDPKQSVLSPCEMLATATYMLNLAKGAPGYRLDDQDHFANRRIRSVGELIQNQVRIGLSRMERVVRDRMTTQDVEAITPHSLINIRPVVASLKEFFGSSQLSQFMDQVNPLSGLTHRRRLSSLGPGGLSRERAGFEVRDVHFSHYGRMCPIETPEGPNIGLIGGLASFARINDFGFIESPYRVVKDGRVTDEIVYLAADDEEEYVIAQANAPIDDDGNFINPRVLARRSPQAASLQDLKLQLEREVFFGATTEISFVPPSEVQMMDISPQQIVSVATALIPFLEHDDANRALMGANMQRQAVPLVRTEAPYAGTGIEPRAARDSGVMVVAENRGFITGVDGDHIEICYYSDDMRRVVELFELFEARTPELLKIRGIDAAQRYLVDEVQKVFRNREKVLLNDKDSDLKHIVFHDRDIELVVRQMTKWIAIGDPGDTDFYPDERVDRVFFEQHNREVMDAGGEPASGRPEVIGITEVLLVEMAQEVVINEADLFASDLSRGLEEVLIPSLVEVAQELVINLAEVAINKDYPWRYRRYSWYREYSKFRQSSWPWCLYWQDSWPWFSPFWWSQDAIVDKADLFASDLNRRLVELSRDAIADEADPPVLGLTRRLVELTRDAIVNEADPSASGLTRLLVEVLFRSLVEVSRDVVINEADPFALGLTRGLVEVSRDVVINEADPFASSRSVNGIWVEDVTADMSGKRTYLDARLLDRVLADDVTLSDGGVIPAGTMVGDREVVWLRDDPAVDRVRVLSPLSDDSSRGISAASYGMSLDADNMIEQDEPVGLNAAQSIGEAVTQLDLGAFYTGGASEAQDLAGGLRRLVELFEARTPAGKAILSRQAGTVRVSYDETSGDREVIIIDDDGVEHDCGIPAEFRLEVSDSDVVEPGDVLVEGPRDPRELLEIFGIDAAQRYLVDEVQAVFRGQDISIHDKHIELIVRQMTNWVVVGDPGDTNFSSDERVDLGVFQQRNREVVDAGGEPASGRRDLKGITCPPVKGIWVEDVMPDTSHKRTYLGTKLFGRVLADDVTLSDGEVIPAGTMVEDREVVWLRDDPVVDRVRVLSPLTDDSSQGISAASYGMSLGTGEMIEQGEPVGEIAEYLAVSYEMLLGTGEMIEQGEPVGEIAANLIGHALIGHAIYDLGFKDKIRLKKFGRTNQDTCLNQKPRVRVSDEVKAGDVLADGYSTDHGELALGKNLLVAFMSWEGYNFEDAIILSERLVRDDVLTSIHIHEYEIDARDTKLGSEEITRDVPNLSDDMLADLDHRGIIRKGAEVGPGDVLVGKVTPKGETELSGEERLLRAIFGDKARDVRDNSLKVPHGEGGKVIDIKEFDRDDNQELPPGVNQLVRVYVAQNRKISVGDKMAGRHGNKGVISRILPIEDMPFTADGTPVDIILNPLGVPSRMNVGQVLEDHLGYGARWGWKSKRQQPDKKYKFQQSGEIPVRDTVRKTRTKAPPATWVTTPVFDSPDKRTLEILRQINPESASGKRLIGTDGKQTLYNGRTGEPYDKPVMTGYVYMLKLNHLVDDKIHARSTGPYSMIHQQPLGGKAQFGGQRFGEMEVWALEAYGSAYCLQEMLTLKSDDVVGRAKVYEAIVKGQNVPKPKIPESFKVLRHEMQALCLNVKAADSKGNEIEIDELDEESLRSVDRLRRDIGNLQRNERGSDEEDAARFVARTGASRR